MLFASGERAGEQHKAAQLERRRATPPDPRRAWIIYSVVALVAIIGNPACVPGLLLIAAGVWGYQRKRVTEHAIWRAQHRTTSLPTVEDALQRAAAYDRQGMPASAAAMRDLATMSR